jgi:sortase B
MDYENDVAKKDRNTVIYGHNMNRDYMFHSLRYYQDPSYYEKNRYIIFDTIYGNQTWEIFAFYKANIDFPYIAVFFTGDAQFGALLEEMKKKSYYSTGVEATVNDRILTLSTCSNQETDTRFVVNAKLISETSYTNVQPNMFFD